jgi:hypothetical protein
MDIIAHLMDGSLLYFAYQKMVLEKKNFETSQYELIGKTRFEIENLKKHNSSIQHIWWIQESELLVLADTISDGFKLISFDLLKSDNSFSVLKK